MLTRRRSAVQGELQEGAHELQEGAPGRVQDELQEGGPEEQTVQGVQEKGVQERLQDKSVHEGTPLQEAEGALRKEGYYCRQQEDRLERKEQKITLKCEAFQKKKKRVTCGK